MNPPQSSLTPTFGARFSSSACNDTVEEMWHTESSRIHDLARQRHCYGEEEDEELVEIRNEPREGVEAMRRLACPYFKRNPKRYLNERSCIGPGWINTHRLKEHIYRCHCLPIHCFRCRKTFGSEQELQSHQRADIPCTIRVGPQREGVDIRQKEMLRSRKRARRDMTEEEKWKDMYRILFPKDDIRREPNPYYSIEAPPGSTGESSIIRGFETTELEDLLRHELPPQARDELDRRIDQVLYPVEESVRARIADIVQGFQLYLFQEYRAIYTRSKGVLSMSPQQHRTRRGESAVQQSLPELRQTSIMSSPEFELTHKPAGPGGMYDARLGSELSLIPYHSRLNTGRDMADLDCFSFDYTQPQDFNDPKNHTAAHSFVYSDRMPINTPSGGTREPSPPPSP